MSAPAPKAPGGSPVAAVCSLENRVKRLATPFRYYGNRNQVEVGRQTPPPLFCSTTTRRSLVHVMGIMCPCVSSVLSLIRQLVIFAVPAMLEIAGLPETNPTLSVSLDDFHSSPL